MTGTNGCGQMCVFLVEHLCFCVAPRWSTSMGVGRAMFSTKQVHYQPNQIEPICRVPETQGKVSKAHGKRFYRVLSTAKPTWTCAFFSERTTMTFPCAKTAHGKNNVRQNLNWKQWKQMLKSFPIGRSPQYWRGTWPVGFERATSSSHITSSTIAPHSQLCLYSHFSPYIILNRV